MNSFDISRKIVHMPGLQMEAWINPTIISTRVKNMAQKMIRTGIYTGGYRSTARMLATQMMKDSGIPESSAVTKWGVNLYNALLTQDTKAEIVELLEAARMVELADKLAGNHEYINGRYSRALKFEYGRTGISVSCYVFPIAMQIAQLAAANRPADQIEAANKLADQLDDIAPIKANIYTPV